MGSEQDSLRATPLKEDTRSSSEIKGDIRQTRDRLDNTLESLNQRLSPRSLVNDVLSWVEGYGAPQTSGGGSDAMKRGYQQVVRQIRGNPMPALLIGAGITWMILGAEDDDASETAQRTGRASDGPPFPFSPGASESVSSEQSGDSGIASVVKEKARDAHQALSNATEAVAGKVSELSSGVQSQTRSARSAISQGIRQSQRVGSGATRHLQKSSVQAGDKFQEMMEEYPFAVAIGFLGVGLLTGLLLPRTRQEDKLVGEKSDQLLEQVKEAGKENLEKAKTIAQRITQTTLDEAERQGITSEAAASKMSEITSKIGTVATKAKEEALRAAEEIKPTSDPESSKDISRDR
jgi:hypothetical protein